MVKIKWNHGGLKISKTKPVTEKMTLEIPMLAEPVINNNTAKDSLFSSGLLLLQKEQHLPVFFISLDLSAASCFSAMVLAQPETDKT